MTETMKAAQNVAPAAADGGVKSNLFMNLNNGMEDKGRAVGVCSLMAIAYVALLYAPAVFLPHPRSMQEHMLRRFVCAVVASAVAPFVCLNFCLSIRTGSRMAARCLKYLVSARITWLCSNDIKTPALCLFLQWQAILHPILLTGMLYLGPLVSAFLDAMDWCWVASQQASGLLREILSVVAVHGKNIVSDVVMWRNCLVAPVSEELVFRACMVPLLLFSGFSTSATVFLCPMFFALAHLHHFWELIYRQNHGKSTAALIVGMQLGYTTVFGWYATFIYLRTGHLIAPIVAHIFCNMMGLPDIDEALTSSHRKVIGLAYVVGLVGFFALLGPMLDPGLFNEGSVTPGCDCWSGLCKWTASKKLEKLMGLKQN